jgi:putative transcriptional regulator
MKKYSGVYHYETCGLDNVYLTGGVFINDIDGEECISIAGVEGLHKIIAENLIAKEGPLTNKEFRFLRKELGLSQEELAGKFGRDVQTIANYEKGKTTINKLEDLALRELYKAGVLRKVLKAAVEKNRKPVSKKPAKLLFKKDRNWHSQKSAA